MNWDRIKGNWKKLEGAAKGQWGKLTDDDLREVEGNQEALIGRIQARYGKSRDVARREVEAWANSVKSI